MKTRVIVIAAISLLLLAGCSSSKKDGASNGKNDSLVSNGAASSTSGFGSSLDLGAGIKATVTAPVAFTPGTFASNYFAGQVANVFSVTLVNGGTAPLDPASFSFAAESGTNSCTDMLDGDNGVSGPPTDPIAAGATANFKIAVGCDAKKGAPLHMTLTVDSTTAAIDGKIA
jgi:hypothetical protein